MSTVRLSDRQHAALLALAHSANIGPITGSALAGQMTANGRDTSTAAAHQAADGLYRKNLAAKSAGGSQPVRYELTGMGRRLAARFRAAS